MSMTKLKPETPITAVKVHEELYDIGAEAAKRLPSAVRFRYHCKITYTLSDGTEFDSSARGKTKPALKERIESIQKAVANGWMFAEQWEDETGKHWSTTTKLCLSSLMTAGR